MPYSNSEELTKFLAQSGNIESLYFDEINKTVASKDDIGVEASVK